MSSKRTVSNIFTVTTMDDPISIVAQYAPNSNPTSSQIHTTWQTGDLYMRTKSTETGATWSAWQRIVGESGGETNYMFALSANKVSQDGTSATAPTDILSNAWQDSPMATTAQKPYLWSKVQKKDGNGNNVGNPSYIRLTGEDGYTVEAQYAPNNNPSTGQIHTTWQDGDLYMRTKQSNETTWSSWHKIVGESGDETDYTFNISKSLTSSSATTAPANCYYNTWQDAPIAPTSTYPYLWMKIVKKTWNESTQSYDSGTARYARVTGEKGENAFVVDLENEMTNVALDESGDLIANFDMYFKVRAYYGTTNVLSDSACSVSASCSDPDVTITDTNAKTTGIRVQISSGTHILDTTEVSVTVTHTAYGTRTVIFTLAGVCGGENAVLQELLPSLDAISFARTASGGLTPSSRALTLSIKKTQGGSTSTQSISDSGLTIRWSYTSMPASKTGGNGWGNGTATGISWNNITMQIANTVDATNIYIAAFNSAGTLVDRETIPVIKDGNNGADGNSAKYISITGACSDGTTQQQSFSLSINDGATTTTYTTGQSVVKPDVVTGVHRGIALARVNRSTLALYGDIQIYDTYGGSVSQGISRADALAQAINSTSTDYFVILMTRDACGFTSSNSSLENAIKNCGGTKIQDTTRTRKAFAFIGINGLAQNYALQMQGEFQVTLGAKVIAYIADGMFTTARTGDDGQKGDTGKTGRFFYYAQEWTNSSTVSYLVSDAQAPYFGYTNSQTNAHNYWVFNPENNGTYTMAQMGAPSSSNPNWQIMTSDFKYLITQAMFTNFAKLGSAVFSGDWMISQYGTPSRNITQDERNIVYLCVEVDGQYPVSTLATILDNDGLWNEYKSYGYTDDELEMLADVCQWAVSVMPNNTDDDRYNVIQNLSNSSYQFFGINSSNKFSVFSPNVAIDYLTGKSYFNDCQIRGNLIGAVSQPFTRIKNTTIWNQYGVKTQDDYGYTRHYLFMKNMPTHKVQIEYMSGTTTEIRRLILPTITQNSLGTEIVVVNVSGDDITVEGKPENSTYGNRGSYLLDGIQTTGNTNDTRTIVMQNQSILKFMSVEIPTQYGEYGWIADGEPQTIKSLA